MYTTGQIFDSHSIKKAGIFRSEILVAVRLHNIRTIEKITRILLPSLTTIILCAILVLSSGQSVTILGLKASPDVTKVAHNGATVDLNHPRVQHQNNDLNIAKKPDTVQWDDNTFELNLLKYERSLLDERQRDESNQGNDPSISHENGPCNLTTVRLAPRIGQRPFGDHMDLHERILICSHVDENNYHYWFTKMYNNRNNVNIHRLHILSSDSMVVFPGIDLICSSYNCSSLTVFNVSGHQIHDPSRFAFWLSQWPRLEILDLSRTSLKSVESILDYPKPSESGTMIGNISSNTRQDERDSPATTSQSLTTSKATTTASLGTDAPTMASQTILKELTKLILDYNNITELDFNFILDRMPNLRYISLVNNSVYDIKCDEDQRPRFRSQFESINLANNSINCDKSRAWLMKQFLSPLTNLKFPDHDQIRCNSSSLVDMTWGQRVSVLETRICEDCDCRSLKRTAISVDCHNKNLTSLPDELPLNTKILNLTSNRINSLSVPYNSRNWENVTYVHLEDNLISSFNPLEFSPKFMRNLAALDIRRNKFREFPSHILEQFINLDQIHLSNNPWLCDCESTFAFQEWLQRHFHKVGDKEEIRCGISGNDENGLKSNGLQQRLSARVIYKLSKSELCPQDNLEEPYDWLDVVNYSLGIAIILILSKVVMDYVYQHRTKRLPHFFKLNI